MQFDKSRKKDINRNWEKNIFISAANFQYPTVKTKDLMKIPISEIAQDDCLLFMWVTSPHMEQGIELGKAWDLNLGQLLLCGIKWCTIPGNIRCRIVKCVWF